MPAGEATERAIPFRNPTFPQEYRIPMAQKQGLFSSLLGAFSKDKDQDELEELAAIEARRRLEQRIEQALAEKVPPMTAPPEEAVNIEAA